MEKSPMSRDKILITGAKGQLGTDLVSLLNKCNYIVYGYSRKELDITKLENVQEIFEEVKPNIVIHAGAHTKVDLAELEQDNTYLINAIGTRNISIEAEKHGAKLVYISTDYVFNGQGKEPYNEFQSTSPLGIYGKSKLAGEEFVRDLHSKFFIVRTSWVYGENGNNFVKTMLKLGKEKDELSVVYDQIGCPTFTVDLSNKIIEIMSTENYGTYHVSNSGSCSWYEFAEEIFRLVNINIELKPVTTDQFPRPAKRPAYSVFDHMSLRLNGFSEMRHWKTALKDFVENHNIYK